MKLLFRCDASIKTGTGHLMRCLTVANVAKTIGWESCFVIRDPSVNIVDQLSASGHQVYKLKTINRIQRKTLNGTQHGDWLPVSQSKDAQETIHLIKKFSPNWVIIDHYALDSVWHSLVKKSGTNILVIDDLGDRDLMCDLLLDHNLGVRPEKYNGRVPSNCKLLLGPNFGLIRSEFKEWRDSSIRDRFYRKMKHVLITMGGVDADNNSLRVLKEIAQSKYAKDYTFTVAVGALCPHVNSLNEFIESTSLKIRVLSNIRNMAELMSKSDLCIGAAGVSALERCCVGLPTISLAIADNQIEVVNQLVKNECSIASSVDSIMTDFENILVKGEKKKLKQLSLKSLSVIDGNGAWRLLFQLEQFRV